MFKHHFHILMIQRNDVVDIMPYILEIWALLWGRSHLKKPIRIYQKQLNSFVYKLVLTKRKSEILASVLVSNNLLSPDECISKTPKLHSLYVVTDDNENEIYTSIKDRRLFIDSSRFSLKAVLMYKDDFKPLSHWDVFYIWLAHTLLLKSLCNSVWSICNKWK